ncbi:hypothetical protein B0H13DRAFT_2377673 [Mycena leptocephala]|nr:hypothetical protein B0H13DRAFT_2377673 [Mycena leptocephala]
MPYTFARRLPLGGGTGSLLILGLPVLRGVYAGDTFSTISAVALAEPAPGQGGDAIAWSRSLLIQTAPFYAGRPPIPDWWKPRVEILREPARGQSEGDMHIGAFPLTYFLPPLRRRRHSSRDCVSPAASTGGWTSTGAAPLLNARNLATRQCLLPDLAPPRLTCRRKKDEEMKEGMHCFAVSGFTSVAQRQRRTRAPFHLSLGPASAAISPSVDALLLRWRIFDVRALRGRRRTAMGPASFGPKKRGGKTVRFSTILAALLFSGYSPGQSLWLRRGRTLQAALLVLVLAQA